MLSAAAEKSLPQKPIELSPIARMPAIGPIPKTRTKTSARISEGTARANAITSLAVVRIAGLETTLRDANSPSGMDNATPIAVARNAMKNVSRSSWRTSERSSAGMNGGHIRCSRSHVSGQPSISGRNVISTLRSPHTAPATKPTAMSVSMTRRGVHGGDSLTSPAEGPVGEAGLATGAWSISAIGQLASAGAGSVSYSSAFSPVGSSRR